MKKLIDRTAVVTGASRGIGLAVLTALAKEGANIIACSSKSSDELDILYRNVAEKYCVDVTPVYFNLADESSVKLGMKKIRDLNVVVDILVNNAGVSHMSLVPFTKMDDLHRVFQINFFSQFLIVQNMLGLLKKSSHASIVNMASVAGIDGGVGVSAYAAAKASMISLTKVLAQECSQMKIRVNAVAPGMINTEMASQMGEKAINEMISTSAAKRLGSSDEIANAVVFLASDDSSYINGQVLRVDGGIK